METNHSGQEEMIRQVLECVDVRMPFKAMDFHTSLIINVYVILLRNSEHSLIVKETNISDRFLNVELRKEFTSVPIEKRNVSCIN